MQSSMSRFCLEKAVRLDGVEYTFIAARALLKSPERYVIRILFLGIAKGGKASWG